MRSTILVKRSVFRWPFDAFDDEKIDWSPGRLKSQSELLGHQFADKSATIRTRRWEPVARPFQIQIEAALKARPIDNRTSYHR